MAQKFSGAARARGFNPIQVSDANIRRMREENQRILEGMRARRESIRENDERLLQAMQDDAAYYDRIRDRDFKIADQNLTTQRQQAEYNAAARQAEINQQTEGLNTLFDGLAKFSSTMAEKQAEKKEKQEAEDKRRGVIFRILFPGKDLAQIKHDEGIRLETEGRVAVEGTLQQAAAEGAPEYDVSKSRLLNTQESAGWAQQDYKQKAVFGFDPYMQQFFQNNPELVETPEAAEAAIADVVMSFMEDNNISLSSPELLAPMAEVIYNKYSTFINGLRAKQTKENNATTRSLALDNALSDWGGQGIASFTIIKNMDGNDAAHEFVKKAATAMDENGDFVLGDEWRSISVYGDGKPYFIPGEGKGTHERRGIEIENLRAEKRREWNRNQNTTERQQYQEESKAWHRHIVVEGNNTPEDLAAAAESFKDDVKGMPEWLRKLRGAGDASRGGYNSGLITTAKDFQARKMLNQDLVDKVFEVDPKLGNELQKSLNEQDPFMRNDRYKALHEVVGKMNTKKDQFGEYPASTVSSYNDSQRLQQNFEQLVRSGVADGASIDDAATNAGRLIEQGHNDESSFFYRRYNPNTGFYEYPNLYTKTAKEIADNLDQADTEFAKRLASGQLQDVFSDPNMILTDVLFDQNVASMSRPGYAFPARVEVLAEKLKASPMEIMQKIADVKGKPAIEPPPSLQQVTEYPPDAKNLLNRFRSTNRDARGHGVGMATIGTGWNEGSVPATLREFYRASAERHGISPAENSAMGEIESNHGMNRVSYNGTSFGVMQINKSAHPAFFAEFDAKNDDAANIDYGTQYYASLKQQYNNDPIVAAMAYNGGPGNYNMWAAGQTPDWVKTEADRAEWQRITTEMVNHGKKFAKALYKYSGDPAILQHPLILRN